MPKTEPRMQSYDAMKNAKNYCNWVKSQPLGFVQIWIGGADFDVGRKLAGVD